MKEEMQMICPFISSTALVKKTVGNMEHFGTEVAPAMCGKSQCGLWVIRGNEDMVEQGCAIKLIAMNMNSGGE